MRLTAIFLLAASLQLSASGLSQTVTLSKKNATLEQVFESLQQQTGYNFLFNSHMLAKAKKVTIKVHNATVEEVLTLCFKDQPFTYVVQDKTIIVKEKEEPHVVVAEAPAPASGPVRGVIKDETNAPLEGAAVTVKGLSTGTVTDKDGKFELNIPAGTYQVEISHVGYKTVVRTVTVGGEVVNLAVALQPAATGLVDAVVVGYGTQRKRDVTGSISSVKGEDIKNVPVSNAADAIQGRATGVDIVRDDGSPGSVPSIRVLGTGTVNNSDPLYVIDGVPSTGGLNDINANDIASIEILKDASASAIYGSRAANGVVLITTKKGSYDQQLKPSANVYAGTKSPVKFLPMLQAPDLVALKTEAYTNDGLTVPTIWGNSYYAKQRTDWQRALMGNGDVQNADVALRGGNANSNYSISGNYYNEKGMIINSYFKRYSGRINSEHKIGSRFRVGENVVYSYTDGAAPNTKSSQTGLVWSAIRFNPAIPVVNSDGSWGTSQADNQLGDINNPVATATEQQKYNKNDHLLANGYAELEIITGLKLRANYGYDHTSNEYYEFDNAMPNQTRGPSIASLQQSFFKSNTFLEEYYLTYNHLFGGVHNVTLTGGYSAQTYSGNSFGASRSGFSDTSQDQRVLSLGTSSSASNYGYNYNPWGLQSYFVRGNYSFMNKYLLTATFRADGSSKFAPGKRWGYFPAFSAGWRLSDEKFYGDGLKNIINSVKLTGGWGQLGNQNVGDFQYLGIIGYGGSGGTGGGGYGYSLGTGTTYLNGAYVTSLANPNITWEKAVTTTIALELAALNNHLTGTITYFNKNTSDMLIPYQIVETFGAQNNLPDDPGNITLPDYNLGELNNHGIEIEVNYQNKAGKVSYSLGANGSFLHNKITRLYGNSTYLASTPYGRENVDISRTYEGQPIASFYGFKTAGLYQSQADIDKDPNVANDPNKANIKPGDVRFRDINGDGIINDKDRVRLGDPNPHFVFGFHGTVNYSRFDLAFNFVGATGFQLYDADRLSGLDATQVYNWYADEKNRWHGAGTSNSIPRLSINNLNNNYRSSDLWVFKGDYLSLKNLTIGYTLPKVTIGDWNLPEIRVYGSMYNVFMLTKYPGYTPELGYTNPGSSTPGLQRGVDLAQYPATRTVMAGATVNF
ncbi:TonB-dependent receptor [Puia dinghuensis]|uniref:SusC/RagA family TonB-linked outer membrane protein n=1 Tax=Puia dinghuensis TaxID=1792502 RepID=A0A8J2UAZ5_9BACT|nr:TonB-dependent receptor [Puia dinghuensis]GGA91898.1 SusC/RagA family TonB-linked outer membrane protein [Puia dinghuensis]